MSLYVFDLDKTLINGDSNELWHEFLYEKKILNDDFIKEDKRLMQLYAQGVLDMDKYLSFALQALSILSVKESQDLMEEFLQEKIAPIVHKEAKELIKIAKNRIIISATPEYIVKNVGLFLGINDCIGMRLIQKNGYFTNKYEKPISYKDGKVQCLKNWLNEKQKSFDEIIFYTDSINDLPLCEFANKTFCVNPDEKLKEIALKKNWEICIW